MRSKLGMFAAAEKFLLGSVQEESKLIANASHVSIGPRGRLIVHMNEFVPGSAYTSFLTGNMYLSGTLRPGDRFYDTIVRHESLHSVLTPRSRVPRLVRAVIYKHSKLYVYLEESAATTYAARSLRQGLKHPLIYGHVKPGRLAAELVIMGATADVIYERTRDHD
jgi:hypothetical protein